MVADVGRSKLKFLRLRITLHSTSRPIGSRHLNRSSGRPSIVLLAYLADGICVIHCCPGMLIEWLHEAIAMKPFLSTQIRRAKNEVRLKLRDTVINEKIYSILATTSVEAHRFAEWAVRSLRFSSTWESQFLVLSASISRYSTTVIWTKQFSGWKSSVRFINKCSKLWS